MLITCPVKTSVQRNLLAEGNLCYVQLAAESAKQIFSNWFTALLPHVELLLIILRI